MSSDGIAVNQSVSLGPLECYDIPFLTICDKFVEIEDGASKSYWATATTCELLQVKALNYKKKNLIDIETMTCNNGGGLLYYMYIICYFFWPSFSLVH